MRWGGFDPRPDAVPGIRGRHIHWFDQGRVGWRAQVGETCGCVGVGVEPGFQARDLLDAQVGQSAGLDRVEFGLHVVASWFHEHLLRAEFRPGGLDVFGGQVRQRCPQPQPGMVKPAHDGPDQDAEHFSNLPVSHVALGVQGDYGALVGRQSLQRAAKLRSQLSPLEAGAGGRLGWAGRHERPLVVVAIE